MKTIGLIGGMSWESSLEYYRILNEQIRARLGGLHSAQTLMYSVDFAEIEEMQRDGRWSEAGQAMAEAGLRLQFRHLVGPLLGDGGRNHVAVARIADGRLEQVGEG